MPRAALAHPNSAMAARKLETWPKRKNGQVSSFGNDPQSPVIPSVPKTGTMPAISNLLLGVPADSARKPYGHGGARNSKARESHALTEMQVANLIAATDHAGTIGLPLTRMITVHWEAAGLPLEKIGAANGRFLHLLTKALARHGSATTALWVQESGAGKGGHCHILAHVPANLVPAIANLQRRWLRSITGKPYRARVIKSDPIGARLGVETGNPALYAVNLRAALCYVLKGTTPAAANASGLTRLEPGGRCIGKRCGVSQNIGPTARLSVKSANLPAA
jgi:hypothetical protein